MILEHGWFVYVVEDSFPRQRQDVMVIDLKLVRVWFRVTSPLPHMPLVGEGLSPAYIMYLTAEAELGRKITSARYVGFDSSEIPWGHKMSATRLHKVEATQDDNWRDLGLFVENLY